MTATREVGSLIAAPTWRQFSFFTSTSVSDSLDSSLSPECLRQPALLSTLASSPSTQLFLSADLEGQINVINGAHEVTRSWRAYGNDKGGAGRCTHIEIIESEKWAGIVITLGEDAGSQYPILKVWDLRRASLSAISTTPPPLLRASAIQYSTRSHPVSALCVSPDLAHVIIASADGTVVSFRHLDQLIEGTTAATTNGSSKSATLGLGKLRILYEGKNPITGLGLKVTSPTSIASRNRSVPAVSAPTLFILTTSQVLSLPLSASMKVGIAPTVLDDFGVGVNCSAIIQSKEGGRLVVAREEAIYVYGDDGREGCYAYEGPKSAIVALSSAISSTSTSLVKSQSNYIAIISPPLVASASSASATIRNYARNLVTSSPSTSNGRSSPAISSSTNVAKVTIFDLENKFVAHTGTFDEGIRDVWEQSGSVAILTEGGKLHRLVEQPIALSLSMLFSRNLYTLAVSLAQSRSLPPSEIAEIYRRYGDHLYSKSDYEGSMECYIKTVGTVQASYVIRKFLDAQRLSHLTSYLQELHSRNLANSDHTTLLLNCYTKLADDTALSSFIHSSSTRRNATTVDSLNQPNTVDVPPFDLETAIRVCRQAGYFTHAVWLAERYGEHSEYLRIQIEDRQDYADALRYVRRLSPKGAEESLLRYGKTLLSVEEVETTKLLIDLCCGTLDREEEGEVEKEVGGRAGDDKGIRSYLGYVSPAPAAPVASSSNSIDSSRQQKPLVPHTVSSLRNQNTISSSPNRKSGIDQLSSSHESPSTSLYQIDVEIQPSCRQFFASFIDHPHQFIIFLETIALRRWGKKLDSIAPILLASTTNLPLVPPRSIMDKGKEIEREEESEERAIWNTLLELYLSHGSSSSKEGSDGAVTVSPAHEHSKPVLEAKALTLLRSGDRIPYDPTQALLVCTAAGFIDGFIWLYESLGMYDEIIRYYISTSISTSSSTCSTKILQALTRYGPTAPELYKLVLRYLTTDSELLSRHSKELGEILETVVDEGILSMIQVVKILSRNGNAPMGVVREVLKRGLKEERDEIESDVNLIASYRNETTKHRKELLELSDPNSPRIFQVTRCSTCGDQLSVPSIHFMCRHSYHARCLPETDSHCPACTRSHAMIVELRRNYERFASEHEIFLDEVRESDDGYATISAAYGRGVIGLAKVLS